MPFCSSSRWATAWLSRASTALSKRSSVDAPLTASPLREPSYGAMARAPTGAARPCAVQEETSCTTLPRARVKATSRAAAESRSRSKTARRPSIPLPRACTAPSSCPSSGATSRWRRRGRASNERTVGGPVVKQAPPGVATGKLNARSRPEGSGAAVGASRCACSCEGPMRGVRKGPSPRTPARAPGVGSGKLTARSSGECGGGGGARGGPEAGGHTS
mmetsp:Transcript_31346/g.91445  ORF Transcript_31346/g.91445 Transcript_31346/m.91445 type:complete len:218 (+) Transcript_31346:1955-2608(+)